jgi:hypothetical protein
MKPWLYHTKRTFIGPWKKIGRPGFLSLWYIAFKSSLIKNIYALLSVSLFISDGSFFKSGKKPRRYSLPKEDRKIIGNAAAKAVS